MDNIELKNVLITKQHVILNDQNLGKIKLSKVTAIIYRADEKGEIKISAECLDYSGKSCMIVNPKYLEIDDGK
ncbi:MAG: hypothetical protein KHW87_04140 [Clostridiales bacterium]|nr:hypothetical protein [Clostridiales bacterium]